MKLLLDTNAYSALMRGEPAVVERVHQAEKLFLSAVVVGELLYGFRHGQRYEVNRRQLEQFLASRFVEFLPVSVTTADRFGLIAAALRRKGQPIPLNDIWIAAHALETGADLLTDDDHFAAVEGLSLLTFSAGQGG